MAKIIGTVRPEVGSGRALRPVRDILELARLARTSVAHRYWFVWVVSNLGGPAPEDGLSEAISWIYGAVCDGLSEEDATEEANFQLDGIIEEIDSGSTQFAV